MTHDYILDKDIDSENYAITLKTLIAVKNAVFPDSDPKDINHFSLLFRATLPAQVTTVLHLHCFVS